ncbi:HYR domain-containing protein [Pseudophaeobacter sp.]|uniref:HYR domain-containing protein n=1 Tax=Pseudophaeobacter sp. TaxID=1971739 RepID=UPI003299967F
MLIKTLTGANNRYVFRSSGGHTISLSAPLGTTFAWTCAFFGIDTQAPVISPVANQAISTDPDQNSASLDVTKLGSVSDNMDTDLEITYRVGSTVLTGYYDFPVGVTTVTMDAQDSTGNAATQVSFTVTVTDKNPPAAPTVSSVTFNPDRTLTVTGTAEPGATVHVEFPDKSVATTIAAGSDAKFHSGAPLAFGAAPTTAGSFSVVSTAAQPASNVTVTAVDGVGNVSGASVSAVTAPMEDTQKIIANFMYSRANQLMGNQPDLTGLLSGATSGAGTGSLDLTVTRGQGHFNLTSVEGKNLWFRLKGARSEEGSAKTSAAFGALGGHLHLRETLLLGAMLQVDHLSQEDGAARLSGTGWMLGPYLVAKRPNDPLFFSGSLLYGESSNRVAPLGTYEDEFDSARLLAQVKVSGQIEAGATLFSPYLDAAYLKEDQEAYTDSLNTAIGAQSIDLMQVSLGLNLAHQVKSVRGDLELRGGVSGIWSSTGGTTTAQTVLPGYAGWRGKLDLGLTYVLPRHGSLTLNAYLDGLGASDFQSYGLSASYPLAF